MLFDIPSSRLQHQKILLQHSNSILPALRNRCVCVCVCEHERMNEMNANTRREKYERDQQIKVKFGKSLLSSHKAEDKSRISLSLSFDTFIFKHV
jgi:hypothetical protein